MKNRLFTGSGVAIVTPFTSDGIDFGRLGSLIDFHVENNTDAIIICGTTGEASTMHDPEHMAAIKFAVEHTAGRLPVIAGTGSNYTQHSIDLSKYAQSVGADGLLQVTPYYNKTTQKGLYEHFKAIADSVDIPIILYNVPSRTGMNIAVDTLVKLAEIDNITAIKEASGNISYVSEIAAKVPDMDIYSGNDDMVVPVMSVGGIGVISVAANIIPQQMHDMCTMYMQGDVKGALKIQLDALDLINKLFIEVNPIPIKTAMNLLGYKVGGLRAPLCDMTDGDLETLKKALGAYGLM